jgi:hypothetical protein
VTEIAERLSLDELDLAHVAEILNKVYPAYTLCECVRMAAEHAPEEGSICSLCGPGIFPGCVRKKQPDAARSCKQ